MVLKTSKTTPVDLLLKYLELEGIEHLFGIPGGLIHPLFSALERSAKVGVVVAKHEEGAVFMADGYARARNGLGVCVSTAGPGATNMLTGVALANSSGIPLLVLTGQVPSSVFGRGSAQESVRQNVDIVGMFEAVTKYSAMVQHPGHFEHHLQRALRRALSGRPGPVHLNVPVDFWTTEIEAAAPDPSRYRPSTQLFDRQSVARAATLLVEAKRPVILAGSGVVRAGARSELLRVAEQLNARVVTTPTAKGVFPETHPLSLGICGFAGHRSARDVMLGSADIVFAVGASLNERSTYNWHPEFAASAKIIQVDIDVDRIGRAVPVNLPVVGDARAVLTELHYSIKRETEDRPLAGEWGESPGPALLDESAYSSPELRHSDAFPLTPQRWRRELAEALPERTILFSDIGGHMLFNLHDLTVGKDQQFHIDLAFGAMGHGTVAPIGAAMAKTGRPVVTIVGDACFTMNGMEWLVAAEHDVPVVCIVENNGMHGISHHASRRIDGQPLECLTLPRPVEICEIARSMGLDATRVDAPGQIVDAFNQALERGRPTIVEVVVDATIPPPMEDRAELIAGFTR